MGSNSSVSEGGESATCSDSIAIAWIFSKMACGSELNNGTPDEGFFAPRPTPGRIVSSLEFLCLCRCEKEAVCGEMSKFVVFRPTSAETSKLDTEDEPENGVCDSWEINRVIAH